MIDSIWDHRTAKYRVVQEHADSAALARTRVRPEVVVEEEHSGLGLTFDSSGALLEDLRMGRSWRCLSGRGTVLQMIKNEWGGLCLRAHGDGGCHDGTRKRQEALDSLEAV